MGIVNEYKDFEDFLDDLGNNYETIEQSISIEVQIEYFNTAAKLSEENTAGVQVSIKDMTTKLNSKETSIEEKKKIIIMLASSDNIEAYKALKKYKENPDEELRQWVALGFQHSKITMENSLLNTNKILISSGLGIKDNLMRFFLVFFKNEKIEFTKAQKLATKVELESIIKREGGEVEKIDFKDFYAKALFLFPIKKNVANTIQEVVSTVNQYGNFLLNRYILTNVKEMDDDMISFLYNKFKEK